MGTVDRKIAERIVAGEFKSDGCVKIVKYKNMFDGGEAFGACCRGEDLMRYERGGACIDPQVWWTEEGGRTEVA
jgi:hypothetical protein